MPQLIPANQQNALPLLSISAATQADTIQIVGGTVSKYWGPSGCGINGATPTLQFGGGAAPNAWGLLSNWLDTTGVKHLAIVFRVFYGATLTAVPGFSRLGQLRLSGADNPPALQLTAGGDYNNIQAGCFALGAVGLANFQQAGNAGEQQTMIINLGGVPFTNVGFSPIAGPVRFGFWLFNSVANPWPAGSSYSLAVYGAS